MTQEEIEQIEISKQQALKAKEKGEALKRLLENPDYKLVISEGFFKDYPKELALAVANNTGAYDSDILVQHLKGINVLKSYEFRVAANLDAAIADILSYDEYIANGGNTETFVNTEV